MFTITEETRQKILEIFDINVVDKFGRKILPQHLKILNMPTILNEN
jgi:hypothetical protein